MSLITRAPARAALVAVAIALAVAVFDMGGWDPTRFVRVGEAASAREFVEADLPDTHLAPGWGHDGQANYVLASVFPDLDEAEGHLDSVSYRARRIVYPALVSWVPRGMPLVLALWGLNLVAIALAAAAIGVLAERLGAPWWAGATVGLSPGFLASMVVDLADGLGLALAALGVLAWRRDRGTALAITLFTVAALTRETTLVVPAAVFLAEGRGRRVALLVPAAVTVAWIAILEVWIGGPGKSTAQFGLPFLGWIDQGLAGPEVAVAFTFAAGSLWVAGKLWTLDKTWALVLLFDLAILVCVDRAVLFDVLNLARVTPWVVPLAVIAVTARPSADDHPARPSADDHPARPSADDHPARPSADEDHLGREVDPVVDRLVDRAAPRHL